MCLKKIETVYIDIDICINIQRDSASIITICSYSKYNFYNYLFLLLIMFLNS